tara:strand:- start:152 stop:1315 length:1164 start_codon:yes stop_codon:yes gene_type:complete
LGYFLPRLILLISFIDLFFHFTTIARFAELLQSSSYMIGVIVAIYSISNFAGNLISGIILDRWGRITPVKFGLFFSSITVGSYYFVNSSIQLFVLRLLHGVGSSVLVPGAYAMLGDILKNRNHGRVMGITGGIIAFSAILGSLAAGLISEFISVRSVFMIDSILLFFCFIFLLIYSNKVSQSDTIDSGREFFSKSNNSLLDALGNKLIISYTSIFFMSVGVGLLVGRLSLVFEDNDMYRGISFTIYALVALFVMISPIVRNYHKTNLIIVGLFSLSLSFLIIALNTNNFIWVFIAMIMFGLGYGALFPSVTSIVSENTDKSIRGKSYGILYACYSIGVVVGSNYAGLLELLFGNDFFNNGFEFYLAFVILLLGAVFTYYFSKLNNSV